MLSTEKRWKFLHLAEEKNIKNLKIKRIKISNIDLVKICIWGFIFLLEVLLFYILLLIFYFFSNLFF